MRHLSPRPCCPAPYGDRSRTLRSSSASAQRARRCPRCRPNEGGPVREDAGHGVPHQRQRRSVRSRPVYLDLIGRFDPKQASLALRAFANPEIASQLQRPLSRTKWTELLNVIDVKVTGRPRAGTPRGCPRVPGHPGQAPPRLRHQALPRRIATLISCVIHFRARSLSAAGLAPCGGAALPQRPRRPGRLLAARESPADGRCRRGAG